MATPYELVGLEPMTKPDVRTDLLATLNALVGLDGINFNTPDGENRVIEILSGTPFGNQVVRYDRGAAALDYRQLSAMLLESVVDLHKRTALLESTVVMVCERLAAGGVLGGPAKAFVGRQQAH